jgi:hypothetical protein
MVLFTISSSTLNNEAVSSRLLIVFGTWYNEAGHDAPLKDTRCIHNALHWKDMKAVAKAKERDQNYETNKSALTYKTWETHFPS